MYVTDRRTDEPTFFVGKYTNRAGYSLPLPEQYTRQSDQVTYSWRTRPGERNSSESDTLYTSSSGSQAQFMKDLRDEDHNKYDRGHEFWTQKREFRALTKGTVSRIFFGLPEIYEGLLVPPAIGHPDGEAYPPIFIPDPLRVKKDGTRGVNLTIPTKTRTSLLVALYELKQDFPKIPFWELFRKRQGSAFAKVGDEYLNYQFGIAPTISDIKGLSSAVMSLHEKLVQFERDANLIVRRKTLVSDESTVEESYYNGVTSGFTASELNLDPWHFFTVSNGFMTITDNVRVISRFAGAYTYFLDDIKNFIKAYEDTIQRCITLLGADLTIEHVYQVTPWSWLLDWFGNFGTLVSNFSHFMSDSIVLRYGYIMHEVRSSRERRVDNYQFQAGTSGPHSFAATWTRVRKQRLRANPFGFAPDLPLNPKQWAILSALGMTQGGEKLLGHN